MSRVELVSISNRVGGPSRLFSRRALKYRALGLDRRTLNEEEMLTYMLEEATFVTRPVVLAVEGPAAVCGSSAKALDGLVRTLLGSR